MTYFLAFCDASDQRLKAPYADVIESESPLQLPSIGDTVLIEQQVLEVVHRHIMYTSKDTTVICYCRESHEGHIRAHCGQSVDLSEQDS